MNTININVAEFGGVIVALLTVGALLKNAFPSFPNRLIPLVTWLLGVLAYQALVSGWGDPKQWLAAVVAAASATGIHSGIKNSVQADEPAEPKLPKILPLLVGIGLLAGCASVKQTATTTTTNPTNGVVTVTTATSSIVATGDAKTIVDKVRASAGKTSSVGASGVSEETTSAAPAAMLQAIFEAAFKAGAKSVATSP